MSIKKLTYNFIYFLIFMNVSNFVFGGKLYNPNDYYQKQIISSSIIQSIEPVITCTKSNGPITCYTDDLAVIPPYNCEDYEIYPSQIKVYATKWQQTSPTLVGTIGPTNESYPTNCSGNYPCIKCYSIDKDICLSRPDQDRAYLAILVERDQLEFQTNCTNRSSKQSIFVLSGDYTLNNWSQQEIYSIVNPLVPYPYPVEPYTYPVKYMSSIAIACDSSPYNLGDSRNNIWVFYVEHVEVSYGVRTDKLMARNVTTNVVCEVDDVQGPPPVTTNYSAGEIDATTDKDGSIWVTYIGTQGNVKVARMWWVDDADVSPYFDYHTFNSIGITPKIIADVKSSSQNPHIFIVYRGSGSGDYHLYGYEYYNGNYSGQIDMGISMLGFPKYQNSFNLACINGNNQTTRGRCLITSMPSTFGDIYGSIWDPSINNEIRLFCIAKETINYPNISRNNNYPCVVSNPSSSSGEVYINWMGYLQDNNHYLIGKRTGANGFPANPMEFLSNAQAQWYRNQYDQNCLLGWTLPNQLNVSKSFFDNSTSGEIEFNTSDFPDGNQVYKAIFSANILSMENIIDGCGIGMTVLDDPYNPESNINAGLTVTNKYNTLGINDIDITSIFDYYLKRPYGYDYFYLYGDSLNLTDLYVKYNLSTNNNTIGTKLKLYYVNWIQ